MKTLLVIALCLVVSCSAGLGSDGSFNLLEEGVKDFTAAKEVSRSIFKSVTSMAKKMNYCKNLPSGIVEAIKDKTFQKDGSVDLSSISTELDKAFKANGKGKAGKEMRRMQMLVRRLLHQERRTAKDMTPDTISNEQMVQCTLLDTMYGATDGVEMMETIEARCKMSQSELDKGTIDTKALRDHVKNLPEDLKDWKSAYDFFEPIEKFLNSLSEPRCGFLYIMHYINTTGDEP